MTMQIKESAENYLETILILQKRNGSVRSIDIAAELSFSKPSVSVAMKNLRQGGYIVMDREGYITLLPPGKEIAALMPDNSDLTAPMGLPAPVTEVDGPVEEEVIRPRYTDIDVNQHVNNTKYLDWCCNALGIETMKTHCMSHFMLNYDKEVRPDQQMNIDLRRLGDDFAFSGSFEGRRHFDVGGTLSLRDPHKALNQ